MKRIIGTLILTILLVGCLKTKVESKLDSSAKVVKEEWFSLYGVTHEDGNQEKQKKTEMNIKYDDKGNILEEIIEHDNSDWFKHNTFEYDLDGNLLKETNYDADGNIKGMKISTLNESGHPIETIHYNLKGEKDEIVRYDYDENNNNYLEKVYSPKGELQSKYVNSFDNNHNKVKSIEYNPNGEIDYVYECVYDSLGNMIEEMSKGGYFDSIRRYKYDSIGNMIQDCKYSLKDSLVEKNVYKYDNNIKTEWLTYNTEGLLIEKRNFTYFENGDKKDSYWYKIEEKFGEKIEVLTSYTERKHKYY